MVKNLKQLFRKFNTEEKCREFLIQQRWNGVPVCPYCGSKKQYVIDNGKRFKCANNECYKKYSVTLGTVMEASNIPLTTWLPAIYIIHSHKKGISSVQLAKDLGVTQKTSWFMLHRIRAFMKDNHPQMLEGTIEADETYMSRKYRSDFKGYTEEQITHILENKSSPRNKGVVMGMRSRESDKIVVKTFDEATTDKICGIVRENVQQGSRLFTDENNKYNAINNEYKREMVRHSAHEWVRGDVHTNNVEAFWAFMKRGLYGIYHQVSFKHLQRYADEFSYRYNTRKLSDGERFFLNLRNIEGRLSYKQLVHGEAQKNNSKEADKESQ